MLVRAYIVKTAQFKASAEDGKFSDAYKREGAALLVHPDDMAAWTWKDGMHVACKNPVTGHTTILEIKQTRNTRKGMVSFNESPWTSYLIQGGERLAELDVEPSAADIIPLEQILSGQGSGVS